MSRIVFRGSYQKNLFHEVMCLMNAKPGASRLDGHLKKLIKYYLRTDPSKRKA